MAEVSPAVVVTVLIIGLAAIIGLTVFDSFADVTADQTSDQTEAVDTLAQTSDDGHTVQVFQQQLFMPSELVSADVYDTNGNQVGLDGSGEVSAPAGIDTADDSWTACTWTELNSDEVSSDANMTVLSVRGEAVIGYDGGADNWTLTYYDRGERVTYNVTADAAATQTARTHLCARRANTELALWVNASKDGTATLDGSGTATLPVNRSNLNGTLEETRTFGEHLSLSEISSLHSSPVEPLVASRGTRLMYDDGAGSSFPAFFASGDATLSGGYAWRSDGFSRTLLSDGTDYELDSQDAQLHLEGYAYEDHPQFYVQGTAGGNGMGPYIGSLGDAIGLAGVIMIALMGGFTVMVLRLRMS